MIRKGSSVNSKIFLERMRIQEGYNDLIKALRAQDETAAIKAISGMTPQDLQITSNEFRELHKDIQYRRIRESCKKIGRQYC